MLVSGLNSIESNSNMPRTVRAIDRAGLKFCDAFNNRVTLQRLRILALRQIYLEMPILLFELSRLSNTITQ